MKQYLLIPSFIITTLFAFSQSEEDSTSPEPTESQENEEIELEKKAEETEEEAIVIRTEIPKQVELTTSSQQLRILSPWAPKPLQAAPIGWRYIAGSPDQAYKTQVELTTGSKLELKITPYILVPEASPLVVQVLEPGYIPADGYRQKSSVTASLEKSNSMLKTASQNLDKSIENLKSLLETLPKPEPAPQP